MRSNMSDPRFIATKYPAKCSGCNQRIAKGELVQWRPGWVICMTCSSRPQTTEAPEETKRTVLPPVDREEMMRKAKLNPKHVIKAKSKSGAPILTARAKRTARGW